MHLFLDVHIKAVLLTILGLTSFNFIQALVEPALRACLLARLRRRINVETMHSYHRCPLGLPLILLVVAATTAGFLWTVELPAPAFDDFRTQAPVPIVAGMSGRVETIYVKEGSTVHIGDPIVQLDSSDLRREKRIVENRIHLAELHRRRDRVVLHGLYRELDQLQLALNRSTITSPVEGWIWLLRPRHIGEWLAAGTAVGIAIRR